jgi:hypothetical protein
VTDGIFFIAQIMLFSHKKWLVRKIKKQACSLEKPEKNTIFDKFLNLQAPAPLSVL